MQTNGDKLIADIKSGDIDLSQHELTDLYNEYNITTEEDLEKILEFLKKQKVEFEFGDTEFIPADDDEQDCMSKSIFAIYMNEIKRYPVLTKEEELKVAQDAANGNKEAENMLICSNLLTPVFLAKKNARSYSEINDLIQAGNLGLMKAVKKFDYKKGFRFSTYASWSVLQEIQSFKNANSGAVVLPASVVYNRNRIKAATSKLQSELGRQPTLPEVARKLNMPVYEVDRIIRFTLDSVSLNNTQSASESDKEMSYIDNLVDENIEHNPLLQVHNQELKINIEYALSKLNQRDALILKMLYGIGFPQEYTYDEVAKVLEVSNTRVRQLEKKALRKMRQVEQKRAIKDYMNYL